MLCILCVTASDQIINIFNENGLQLDITAVITKHFWLQPNAEDSNAKVICCSCWNILDSFHKFYQKVEDAHTKLINIKSPVEDDVSDSANFDAYSDFYTTDIKLETYEDAKVDLPQLNIENPTEQMDSTNRSDEAVQALKSSSESDVPVRTLRKRAKRSEQIGVNKNDSDVSTNNKKRKRNELTVDDDSDYNAPKNKIRRRSFDVDRKLNKKKISCKEFDDIIKHHMELSCEICHVSLATFFALKEHYRSVHNEVGFVNCCDKKIDSRHALVQHILLHQDPEFFKCDKCSRILTNRKNLKNHMKTHQNEDCSYKCDKCKKSFSKKERLERHMKTHVKADQICEHCGKVIRNNGLKQHQLREHSGIKKQRVQCQKCGVDLADSSSLSFHMKYQHPEKNIVHKCNICGKISTTGYGLKRHIMYMHKRGRPHKCPMCEKAFKTAQKLREHMTTHTGEVLYTCPHCPKTFNSNANMHSHRKKMHRKEWEENRRHPHMGSTANPE